MAFFFMIYLMNQKKNGCLALENIRCFCHPESNRIDFTLSSPRRGKIRSLHSNEKILHECLHDMSEWQQISLKNLWCHSSMWKQELTTFWRFLDRILTASWLTYIIPNPKGQIKPKADLLAVDGIDHFEKICPHHVQIYSCGPGYTITAVRSITPQGE